MSYNLYKNGFSARENLKLNMSGEGKTWASEPPKNKSIASNRQPFCANAFRRASNTNRRNYDDN